MTHAERQRALAKRYLEAGKCVSCGSPRKIEKGATKLRCAKCAELQRNAYHKRSKSQPKRKDTRTAPAKWVKRVPKHGEMIWDEETKQVIICSTLVNDNAWVLIPK